MKRILATLCLVGIIPALTACPAATFSVSIPFGGDGKSPVGAFNYAGTIPAGGWFSKSPTVIFTPATPDTPPAVVTPDANQAAGVAIDALKP